MSGFVRVLVPVVCIGVTVAGLVNTYGDASVVERLAEQEACGKEHCSVTTVEMQRNPFSHRYVFQTSVERQQTTAVECAREYVLIGNYGCKKQ
jgi:hypothetical protein